MSAEYLVFLVVGRLLIFFGAKFAKDNEIKIKFFERLFSCPLCLGVWVYAGLSLIFGVQAFDQLPYIPMLSEVVTGCASSFVMYYFIIGWKAVNDVVVI